MSTDSRDDLLRRLGPGPAAYEPAGPDQDEDEGGLDLRRLLSAVWRRKWLVVAFGALGIVAGYGASRLVKPIYEAQASIQLPAVVRSAGSNPLMRAAPILEGTGWVELLRSFAVLDEVVLQRRLFLETSSVTDRALLDNLSVAPNLVPGVYRVESPTPETVRLLSETGETLDEVNVGDSLGLRFGFRWAPQAMPAGRAVQFRVRRPRDASVRLNQDLSVNLPREGTLMRISLRGEDAQHVAATVNAVANRFVEFATLLKREKLTTVTEALREQLINARIEVERAENALESHRVATITLPTDRGGPAIAPGLQETRDPVRQAFFALRTERESVARDRDAIRRALALAGDSARNMVASLGTIAAVRESAELMTTIADLTRLRGELRQTRLVLAPERPEVQQLERQVNELERVTIPAQATALASSLELRLADLDRRIASSSREMEQIPARVTEENRRERNVAVATMIYTELQSAYEQARLAELSAAPDVRVLDVAVPPTRPIQDQMLIVLGAGTMGGLGFGLLLTLLLDHFDPRIRYPDQVTRRLGLTILGAVPQVRRRRNGKAVDDDEAALREAMRAIRMSLLYAHGSAGAFATTITSPGPGDGKSFVSTHLAGTLAQSGRRTLLVDGDNRRGLLHRRHEVARRPGLTDVLLGKVSLDDAIVRTKAGFDLLPCGTRLEKAPEMLSSPQMTQLMMQLRGTYEALVLDSPPLNAGIDALVLGSLAGTLALVVRTGVTDGALAEARLNDIGRLPIRLLGAVLNDVKAAGVYRYYGYLPGYGSADESNEIEGPSGPPLIETR